MPNGGGARMSRGMAYVVDDDDDIRRSVRDLVSSVGIGCETFGSAETFLRVDTERRPSAVILDVRLPGFGGLEIQENLLAKGAIAPVIFITAYGDVWTAVQAMKRGAFDFLEKPFSGQELLTSIQAALKYHAEQLEMKGRLEGLDELLRRLTPRELDILMHLAAGKSNKTAANELGLSVRTVEFHRANLMRKLHANSREAVTHVAFELLMAQLRRGLPT